MYFFTRWYHFWRRLYTCMAAIGWNNAMYLLLNMLFLFSIISQYTFLQAIPPKWQWMDYRCWLGNSSTASGISDPWGDGRLGRAIVRKSGFFLPVYIFAFFSFFVVFQLDCSHAQVFGSTLVHELHIFCSLTEWNLVFSLHENSEGSSENRVNL